MKYYVIMFNLYLRLVLISKIIFNLPDFCQVVITRTNKANNISGYFLYIFNKIVLNVLIYT